MSIIGSNILAGASGQGGGYTIKNSLRFRSSASAYLSRTPASAGNRKTWTWSGWVKRGTLSSLQFLFQQGADQNNASSFQFNSGDTLEYNHADGGTNTDQCVTSAVFRDTSAWYHIVLSVDTTQAIDTNRIKIYVNGTLQSLGTANYPAQNVDTDINTATPFRIGSQVAGTPYYFDGYITEINLIDGQALDPSSFGEYNEDTGVWQPIKYSGSYGTNGFYLPFSDNTTTTTLVADASGNGNDWTPNNISLTSGVTYDSMTDTPTPYADGGNYCVLNSLNQNSAITLSAGNLSFTASNNRFTTGTFAVTSGKWYLEFYPVAGGASGVGVGAILATTYVFGTAGFANGAGYTGVGYTSNGSKYVSGTSSAYGATYGSGNVIGVALDLDSGTKTITFYKDNTSQGSINLPTSSESWIVATDYSEAGTHSINFGQRPFAYTPPTGFKPLHTGNLPDSAIVDGSEYFDVLTYTGDDSTSRSITGLSFAPDFVWHKARNAADDHRLMDSVRAGGTDLSSSVLYSNLTNTQDNASGYLTQASSGFNLGVAANPLNLNTRTYVAWNWKAGTAFSNDAGTNGATIASVGSVNQDAGFSIVTYTGNGSAGATIFHGLGVAPSMIIVKRRDSTGGGSTAWGTYHKSLGATKAIWLNEYSSAGTNTAWNNTSPTSSVFYVGGTSEENGSGTNIVAYCFAEVEGYSKFESYTGNGITDGPFIYCGFKPRYIVIKGSTVATSWYAFDTARSTYNENIIALNPDNTNTEASALSTYGIDILSNGFKIRQPAGYGLNNSGQTYIYMAFAENPFKNSLAR
jgi:hypothetical protein